MAVIADYMSGNAHIIIHDDCLPKTKEEADRRLASLRKVIGIAEMDRVKRMLIQQQKDKEAAEQGLS